MCRGGGAISIVTTLKWFETLELGEGHVWELLHIELSQGLLIKLDNGRMWENDHWTTKAQNEASHVGQITKHT